MNRIRFLERSMPIFLGLVIGGAILFSHVILPVAQFVLKWF